VRRGGANRDRFAATGLVQFLALVRRCLQPPRNAVHAAVPVLMSMPNQALQKQSAKRAGRRGRSNSQTLISTTKCTKCTKNDKFEMPDLLFGSRMEIAIVAIASTKCIVCLGDLRVLGVFVVNLWQADARSVPREPLHGAVGDDVSRTGNSTIPSCVGNFRVAEKPPVWENLPRIESNQFEWIQRITGGGSWPAGKEPDRFFTTSVQLHDIC